MSVVQELQPPVSAQTMLESPDVRALERELAEFNEFGKRTTREFLSVDGIGKVPFFINEFWTARQRQASSLHEVSYRACFKPQLPRFFIERLTHPGDVVYDPFMGRGTTLVEAALLGRTPYGCDINPLSQIFVRPRLNPPSLAEVEARLKKINFKTTDEWPEQLLVFFHPETLREICALKKYLLHRKEIGALDDVDSWIWMVATNRLTGHSAGFFSVYTLPPNQAVSVESQIKINGRLRQTPPRRHVPVLILRKSKQLLADLDERHRYQLTESIKDSLLATGNAADTPGIPSNSVVLVVTSPPFLDVVDYEQDNWLRAWFCGIDISNLAIWQIKDLGDWEVRMTSVLLEVHRVLRPGGWVAFEVGEVRNGKIKLENSVLKVGREVGLRPVLVLINDQIFTKTSNCWGIENLKKGTNTNRIILFQKLPET
ncbi:MAG TPA: DNA methyltransferase [Verrucomicrobiae bacterium]|nr:DNA methyltransferase [Verrucomicrobiae bacterium]